MFNQLQVLTTTTLAVFASSMARLLERSTYTSAYSLVHGSPGFERGDIEAMFSKTYAVVSSHQHSARFTTTSQPCLGGLVGATFDLTDGISRAPVCHPLLPSRPPFGLIIPKFGGANMSAGIKRE